MFPQKFPALLGVMDNKAQICFAGKAEKSIDSKRRINVPAQLINQVSDKVFHITRGQDQNLFVYPKEVFFEKAARLNKHFGSRGQKDREKRVYFLETMADAHPVQCDQQGRISIPQEFLDYARIKDKVLIIGAFDKLVFWNPEIFNQFKKTGTSTAQERVHQFGWADREQDERDTSENISQTDSSE
jgi:division/cell wall cluster transcriptional repressor MraZ